MVSILLITFNTSSEVKKETKTEIEELGSTEAFSPETANLIKGLSDSPESLQLKAEILRSVNELKRGTLRSTCILSYVFDFGELYAKYVTACELSYAFVWFLYVLLCLYLFLVYCMSSQKMFEDIPLDLLVETSWVLHHPHRKLQAHLWQLSSRRKTLLQLLCLSRK